MSEPTKLQRWIFLVVISTGLLILGIDSSILYTALPTLRHELHTTELQNLWIINAYPLLMCGLMLGTGTLGDKIGHRLLFLLGVAVFGVGSVVCAAAPTAWFLVFGRAILGIGASMMMPSTLALIRVTFLDEQERNTALGIWGSVWSLGSAVGPVVGGFLLEYFWWGSIFLINIPVVILTILATIAVAPANMPNPKKHWDFRTSLYALVSLGGLVMAIKLLFAVDHEWIQIACSAIAVIVGGFLFAKRQNQLVEPLLDFEVFRNRVVVAGVCAAVFSIALLSAFELITSQRFQMVLGYTPLQAGLISAVLTVATLPTSVAGGMLLRRLGFQFIVGGGFILTTLGLTLIYTGFRSDINAVFYAGIILLGLGIGASFSVTSIAILAGIPAHRAGMASAVEEVSYELGALVSVAAFGSLAALMTAQDNHYDEAYRTVLVSLISLSAIATVTLFFLFRGAPRSFAEQ